MKLGLSPMDGVTDAAMRYMTAKYSRPDFLFTEFVSVDALHFATGERRERLLKTFIRAKQVAELQSSDHSPKDRQGSELGVGRWPLEIAQVFGHTPEYFKEAAVLIEKLGFDGIDINMGCPMHKVEDQGSGAGLIRTPELAKEIIKTVKAATNLPVSVKTRIGVDKDVVEEWMEHLMEVKPVMISLHGRTLRQLYQGRADWDSIERAAKVVHKYGGVIMGNGDVQSVDEAREKVVKYGVDGVLIGRAAEGNPAIFISHYTNTPLDHLSPSKEQRLAWMLEHAKIYELLNKPLNHYTIEDNRWFMPMRKHLAWYCKGFEGAVTTRSRLMLTNSAEEVEKIVQSAI
ncbi:MAG: tRNA-dihydrouridine synthase [Microgenomates group bacterium]